MNIHRNSYQLPAFLLLQKSELFQSTGSLLVEVLIVMGLMALLLPALVGAIITTKQGEAQRDNRVQATGLLKEAIEAVRVVREDKWSNVEVNGTYHPVVSGPTWALSPGTELINGFTRSIIISDVYRNSGAIVTSGGSIDPSTKKMVVTVSWLLPTSSSISTELYLSRYLDNLTMTETTTAHFNAGTTDGTSIGSTSGGVIFLGSGGQGNWCQPFDAAVAEIDLPKSGVANAISALEGKIYAGTGENSSGVSFANVSVSNDSPPTLSLTGTLDGYKTNDVHAEMDYVYIATDDNGEEVVIIDLTTTPYQKIGYFNAPGSTNAQAVITDGDIGYVLQGNTLLNFNLTSKTGSRSGYDSDGVTLDGQASSIQIIGSYAYVSINGTGNKLQIVDLSNPSNLQVVAQVNTSSVGAIDLAVNDTGNRVYLITGSSSSQSEMFIINSSTKSGNLPVIASYDTNGMDPMAVDLVPGNIVLLGGKNGEEYQSVNISNEGVPVKCGALDIPAGINDLASILEADGDAYSYLLTATSDKELKVLEGGPGGQYASSGTFTSKPIDVTSTTAFNYIEAHSTIPDQTTSTYQVAVADAVNNNCTDANYVFVGPDGTSGTFYTTEGPIALNDGGSGFENPGRCFKYKVYLETNNSSSTPLFEDITVNYSP